MRSAPDPLKLYAHAIAVGDHLLAELVAQRLFPWLRRPSQPDHAPGAAARRTLSRLMRTLFGEG